MKVQSSEEDTIKQIVIIEYEEFLNKRNTEELWKQLAVGLNHIYGTGNASLSRN